MIHLIGVCSNCRVIEHFFHASYDFWNLLSCSLWFRFLYNSDASQVLSKNLIGPVLLMESLQIHTFFCFFKRLKLNNSNHPLLTDNSEIGGSHTLGKRCRSHVETIDQKFLSKVQHFFGMLTNSLMATEVFRLVGVNWMFAHSKTANLKLLCRTHWSILPNLK